MTDMSQTILPKSNQLNADDLIVGPVTVRVTKVSAASAEQPIAINYEGDAGKPYYPCKSMRRVLVTVWGVDGAQYVGRSMTLYRDDKVVFGGIAVGGIRISHMSHMKEAMTMALTASKASRKPFTVRPLKNEPAPVPASEIDPLDFDAPTYPITNKNGGKNCTSAAEYIDTWRSVIKRCLDANAPEKIEAALRLNSANMAQIEAHDAPTVETVKQLAVDAMRPREPGEDE